MDTHENASTLTFAYTFTYTFTYTFACMRAHTLSTSIYAVFSITKCALSFVSFYQQVQVNVYGISMFTFVHSM